MKLLLNGGGSTKELVLTMKKLGELIDHSKPILYVPLAMDEDYIPYDDCYEWFKKQMINISDVSFDMVRSFEEFSLVDLSKYSAIFIGGGNTYKLLKGIKDNNIFDRIISYDGVIVGCSAGSIIFGYDIDSCSAMDLNYVRLTDTKGFNMLGGKSIFPHYTNSKTEEIHKKYTDFLLDYSTNNEDVIAIPEEDTIYVDEYDMFIFGDKSYYEFSNGKVEKYDIDETSLDKHLSRK